MNEPVRLSAEEITRSAMTASLADEYGPLIIATTTLDRSVLGAEPCIVLGVDALNVEQANTPDNAVMQAITSTVDRAPTAAITACVLLRSTTAMTDVDARLALESVTYSALQAGPDFARWRAGRPIKESNTEFDPAVVFERVDNELRITLNRPHHGNAVNRALRDALTEGAQLALLDDQLTSVTLRGNGRHFCTGGDLDEFGSFASPAEAHLVRLQRSPARLLDRLSRRLTVHLHGNCAGSGVELAAFAHRVVAAPETTFTLPEIGLGLVPGAGGTVSIVDRIGPERTLQMLLTGERIDAPTALAWGLVDEIRYPGETRM